MAHVRLRQHVSEHGDLDASDEVARQVEMVVVNPLQQGRRDRGQLVVLDIYPLYKHGEGPQCRTSSERAHPKKKQKHPTPSSATCTARRTNPTQRKDGPARKRYACGKKPGRTGQYIEGVGANSAGEPPRVFARVAHVRNAGKVVAPEV